MTSHRSTLKGMVGLVAATVCIWIIATPPSAGPDEPDHVVRGAALVRGELDGVPDEITGDPAFMLPPWVGAPDPGCFAQQPYTPVTCATSLPRPAGEDVLLDTRAADYPVWAHLLPGLGTLLPAEVAGQAARVFDAIGPVLLVGIGLFVSARRGWLSLGAALLALTPMAWFMFAVVNPSGLVIAGGFALWIGLDAVGRDPTRLHRWLVAGAWAALVLPRRDGIVWAVLIVSIDLLVASRGLRRLWSGLGIGPAIVVTVSTAATLIWAATSDATSSKMLILAPLIPFVAVGARAVWRSPSMAERESRVGLAAALVTVVVATSFVAMDRRPGGFDDEVLRIVIGRTGLHLNEAIGVLGWLDTPIPATLAMLWLVALGMLVGVAVACARRGAVVGAGSILLAAVLASWVLEMVQGDPSGTYWQGRYYLPLLVGIPIVLSRSATSGNDVEPTELRVVEDRIGRCVTAIALAMIPLSLAAAMRRWSVGLAGPMLPWEWNTYDSILPPALLLLAQIGVVLAIWVWASTALSTP